MANEISVVYKSYLLQDETITSVATFYKNGLEIARETFIPCPTMELIEVYRRDATPNDLEVLNRLLEKEEISTMRDFHTFFNLDEGSQW